jgi:hypothetical protein
MFVALLLTRQSPGWVNSSLILRVGPRPSLCLIRGWFKLLLRFRPKAFFLNPAVIRDCHSENKERAGSCLVKSAKERPYRLPEANEPGGRCLRVTTENHSSHNPELHERSILWAASLLAPRGRHQVHGASKLAAHSKPSPGAFSATADQDDK